VKHLRTTGFSHGLLHLGSFHRSFVLRSFCNFSFSFILILGRPLLVSQSFSAHCLTQAQFLKSHDTQTAVSSVIKSHCSSSMSHCCSCEGANGSQTHPTSTPFLTLSESNPEGMMISVAPFTGGSTYHVDDKSSTFVEG